MIPETEVAGSWGSIPPLVGAILLGRR